MFENMMKYEKAWDEFETWAIKHNTEIEYEDPLFILGVMPFFFDKKHLYIINNERYSRLKWGGRVYDFIKDEDREKSLIKACEKAFKIYNKRLEAQNV